MRKKRAYWGCEMESKLYWEVVKEKIDEEAEIL